MHSLKNSTEICAKCYLCACITWYFSSRDVSTISSSYNIHSNPTCLHFFHIKQRNHMCGASPPLRSWHCIWLNFWDLSTKINKIATIFVLHFCIVVNKLHEMVHGIIPCWEHLIGCYAILVCYFRLHEVKWLTRSHTHT